MTQAEQSWADWAKAAVREGGYRGGGARWTVIEFLSRQSCCLSAQEIHRRLRDPAGIGVASVYRALDLLHGLGLVQRVDLGDGEARYEPVDPGGEHHHHAVCDSCGRVTPFQDDLVEEAIGRVADRLPHAVGAHDLVVHGECGACEAEEDGPGGPAA